MIHKFPKEYVPYEELYMAYLDCRKRKRRTANACLFEKDEAKNLYDLWVDLNSFTYKIGKSITFVVDKPVKREIFAANFRDRIVHHLIVNRILHYFEEDFIDDSYSCRKGKGTEYGVQRCKQHIEECSDNYTKQAYILKCDLRSFFMSIDKTKLYNMLKEFLQKNAKENKETLDYDFWLIRLIVFNNPQDNCVRKQDKSHWDDLPKNKSLFYTDKNFGLPIGNLTSQLFANFYLSWFDHWIQDELKIKYYGRYVDDFYLVSEDKEQLLGLIDLIKAKLKDFGITLHPKKIYLQDIYKGVKFIGSVIKPHRVYISKRTVGNAWMAFQNVEELVTKYPKRLDVLEHCVAVMNSYLGFMLHKATFNVRKKLLLNKKLKVIWEYCYCDDDFTKIMLFKNYISNSKHRYKYQYKEVYKLINNREECIQKIQEFMQMQVNTLSMVALLDLFCLLENMKM